MATASNQEQLSQDDLLEAACARNLAVALHFRSFSGDVHIARSRVLGSSDELVYLDRPQCIGGDVRLNVGMNAEVYVNLFGTLMTFQSEIVSLNESVWINENKQTVGMTMRRPTKIRPGQRRDDYRVLLSGDQELKAEIHPAGLECIDAVPIDGPVTPITITNASAGGAGLLIRQQVYSRYKVGRLYFLSTTLPDGDGPLSLLFEIRHSAPIHNGESTKIGAKFVEWPNRVVHRHASRRLSRFVTAIERARAKTAA